MAITKQEFINAFREAASAEFDHIPQNENEIKYVFSPRFETKMQKLIKREKSTIWHLTNTGAKRVAIIAAAVLLLLITACSIPTVREDFAGLFTEIHDGYYDVFFKEETASIEVEYYISSIPEGFELDEAGSFASEAVITQKHINSQGDEIKFSQSITADTFLTLDSELGQVQELKTQNGRAIVLHTLDNMLYAMWIEEGYLFEIVIYGEYDKDFILTLVDSVTSK